MYCIWISAFLVTFPRRHIRHTLLSIFRGHSGEPPAVEAATARHGQDAAHGRVKGRALCHPLNTGAEDCVPLVQQSAGKAVTQSIII